MPEQVLIVNQYGKEAVHGTAVAADTRLFCTVALPDSDRTLVVPRVGMGQRVPGIADSPYIQRVAVEGMRMEFPEAYYQTVPLLYSALLEGNITAVEQNPAEGDYLWTFDGPLTGTETIDTFTLETADNAAANYCWEMEYCLIPEMEITISAETGEVSFSCAVDAAQMSRTTLTSVATIPNFTGVVGKLCQVWADDTWANLGTTELADSLVDARISISGGCHHKRTGGSTRLAETHGQGEIVIEVELGLERTSTVLTEQAYFFTTAPTMRTLRLKIDSGVQIGAGDNHSLMWDLAGNWVSWQGMGRDYNGNNLDVATFRCSYDPTGTKAFSFTVTTDHNAI